MARVVVVPEPIDYPDSDGLPMAENESQFWPILYVGSALDRYYQDRDDVYVVGNLLVYYQQGDGSKSVSPDLMDVRHGAGSDVAAIGFGRCLTYKRLCNSRASSATACRSTDWRTLRWAW